MDLVVAINIFFGFVIFVSLVVLWFVWPPDSPWSPWWQIKNSSTRESMRSFVKVTKKDVVYDLGSGDGRVPIIAAKEFGAKGVGIEIDFVRHWIALIKVRLFGLSKKVTLKRGNFFDYKINDATVIMIYLVPVVLERLKPKLIKELKKGTRVVSYRYKFKPSSKLKFVKSDPKTEMHLYKIV